MTFLITGGTGKTGLALARLLRDADYPVLLTSRSGIAPDPFKAIAFDWLNHDTHQNPFNEDPLIKSVYLIGPRNCDVLFNMRPFIDLAISKGVERFVYVSSTLAEPGSEGPGEVHSYLAGKGVDYAVLRPSWFFDNFLSVMSRPIREQDIIPSTIHEEKIPYVDVNDIADVAFEALTAKTGFNKDCFILGPQYLTYDEIAEMFTEVLGRTITHKKLTVEDGHAFWTSFGPSREFAERLVRMEQLCANGAETSLAGQSNTKRGRRYLKAYIEINKFGWAGDVGI